jgi:hypothetical protein
MSSRDFVQLGLYLLALVVATPVLGAFMARTFQDRPTLLSPTGSLTSASERRCAHAGKVVTSQDRQKPERVGEIAAKAVVQPARKLREVRAELRAVGSLNNVELITAPVTVSLALYPFSCGFSTGWCRSSYRGPQ